MSRADHDETKSHNLRQLQYFEGVAKKNMVPVDSTYLRRHIDQVLRFVELTPKDRVLEVGCGMGRYTLLLAEQSVNVTGMDLSRVLLARLRAYSEGRYTIPLIAADLEHPPIKLHGGFDIVMGFFMLHHLHNLSNGLTGVRKLIKPGGCVVFLEPNPFNPLYYLQILSTPGMTWAGERGMLKMRPKIIFQAMRESGLTPHSYFHFGCLPPQIVNRGWGAKLEDICERFPILRSLRPFTLFKGQLA